MNKEHGKETTNKVRAAPIGDTGCAQQPVCAMLAGRLRSAARVALLVRRVHPADGGPLGRWSSVVHISLLGLVRLFCSSCGECFFCGVFFFCCRTSCFGSLLAGAIPHRGPSPGGVRVCRTAAVAVVDEKVGKRSTTTTANTTTTTATMLRVQPRSAVYSFSFLLRLLAGWRYPCPWPIRWADGPQC